MLLSVFSTALTAQIVPGQILWAFDPGTGNVITSSPALGDDGTIYFGASGTLCAVARVGTNKWTFSSGGYDDGSPAIGLDGTIYYGSIRTGSAADGYLYAVTTNGTQQWSYLAGGGNGSAAIGFDNTVYFDGSSSLLAMTPGGLLVWAANINPAASGYSSPIISANNCIYIANFANRLFFGLDSKGTVLWRIGTSGSPSDSSAIGSDGTIYVSAGPILALTPTGSNTWAGIPPVGDFSVSPAIGKDGTVYSVSQQGDLFAFSATGQLKWQATTNGAFTPLPPYQGGPPAIDSLGLIYYVDAGILVCVSPQGQIQWTFQGASLPAQQYTAPVIAPDGTIYATLGTKLYAITGTNKLADTPWPMYRQNPRHTGKVEKPSLGQPKKHADASVELQLFGQASSTFSIQSSTNLTDWISFTNLLVTNLPMDFVDPDAGSPPVKFYRASGPAR